MQIDYAKLATIATDPTSRSTMANDTSEVLAAYLQILSNLIYAAERLSESEMAMIISSLNQWITKKERTVKTSYGIGKSYRWNGEITFLQNFLTNILLLSLKNGAPPFW